MKKTLFLLTVLAGSALGTFAQTAPSSSSTSSSGKFSIGFETGLPVGDASQVYSVLVGGSIQYDAPTAPNTFLTLSAGFNSFLVKSEFTQFGGPSSFNFIPLKAGIKYFVGNGVFLAGELGIVFSTESGGGHAFVYAPGVGYSFNDHIEAGVRYEGWANNGTVGQIGLRVAYKF